MQTRGFNCGRERERKRRERERERERGRERERERQREGKRERGRGGGRETERKDAPGRTPQLTSSQDFGGERETRGFTGGASFGDGCDPSCIRVSGLGLRV